MYWARDVRPQSCVWINIRRSIYGLPQSRKLANDYLRKKIAPHGYFEVKHTPGLWKHITRPIQFNLVVDDFGVKYNRQKDTEHPLSVLEKVFTAVSTDWEGALYCGIQLEWNYGEIWLYISSQVILKKYYKITSMNHPQNHNTHHISSPQRNMAKMPMNIFPKMNPQQSPRKKSRESKE